MDEIIEDIIEMHKVVRAESEIPTSNTAILPVRVNGSEGAIEVEQKDGEIVRSEVVVYE